MTNFMRFIYRLSIKQPWKQIKCMLPTFSKFPTKGSKAFLHRNVNTPDWEINASVFC